MHALFQSKQLALQQKLQAGQMTLAHAQQVSQMQQVWEEGKGVGRMSAGSGNYLLFMAVSGG